MFRRLLLVLDLGADAAGAAGIVRRIAPGAERLVVLARQARPLLAWPAARDPTSEGAPGDAALDRLRAAVAGLARSVEVRLPVDLGADALVQAARSCEAEVIAAGPLPLRVEVAIAEARRRLGVSILWARGASALAAPQPPASHLACATLRGASALASLGPFLRDHARPWQRVTLLVPESARDAADLPSLLETGGVRAHVEVLVPPSLTPAWVMEWAREHAVDAFVLPQLPPAPVLDLVASRGWPVLVAPPPPGPERRARGVLDAPDLADDGGSVRIRLEQVGALGRPSPIPEERIAFVCAGRVVATATSREGAVELPAGTAAATLGMGRLEAGSAVDPLAVVERQVSVLRPGPEHLVLVDAAHTKDELTRMRATLESADAPRAVAVRLRPTESFRAVRRRFRAAGFERPGVLDASLVLDEGDPDDVPEEVDPVRLARVAARLRGAGFAGDAIVHRGTRSPEADGFAVLRADGWPPGVGFGRATPVSPPASTSLAARLDATTGAPAIPHNRIDIETDNGEARRWLLGAVEASRERVHLQVYIAADDEVTRRFESALSDAAARGVQVRILVDSLYSLHGSFGARNSLLERLSARPGIAVRGSRPVGGIPSLEDLKQRDHRKLAVFDGRVALLGGRNLAREYYRDFAEVTLTPRSPWREVPWLDAGARVEGPAVAALDRCFQQAWTEAGGDAFRVAEPGPAGPTAARVVVHRGLRDARTLEAYLALIETARSHLHVVNGFPLQLEVQSALLRAVRRGIRVRALFGNVLPLHGAEPFGGFGTSPRVVATQLVHARMDALVAAGAEGYQLAVSDVPGWDGALGPVLPHVHAKIVSADGAACAIGSANLDITAGYWESELLLVVEDPVVAGALEARLDALLARSVRVDPADPAWQQLASRRAWLSRYWPAIIG